MHHLLSRGKTGGCRCPHHFGLAVLVILLGLAFLLQAAGVLTATTVGYIWPSLIILAGVYKLLVGICSCCRGSGMSHGASGGKCEGECTGECGEEDKEEGCCSDDMKGSCCDDEETHSHETKK